MKASQVITRLITGGAILLLIATRCSSGSYSNDDKIIYRCDNFTMYADSIVSDSVRATALSASCVNIIVDANTTDMYADSATTSTYPLFRSEQPLVDAMYSLERSTALAHDPFTITMLSAMTDPRQAMTDLRAMIGSDGLPKSKNWPIVDTSAAWIIAASEVYAVTGDKQWLREILPIAKRAIQRTIDVNYDLRYGLIRGTLEYSDGTTPYVPTWMTGTDRIASLELGVNSMYVAALTATAMMAAEAGDTADHYRTLAESVALNVCNRLWIPEAGYFSSMLYGAPYPVQSHNIDYTAQAITIIAGISNKEISKSIVSKTPLPSPYLPDTYPRPSDAAPTRPSLQRQAVFGLASAVTGYTTGIMSAIGSVIYASVTYPDHYNGALSSLILRAIAGMRFTPEGITFVPSIPAAMQGDKTISGIKYRDSELCVTLHGTGSSIGRFMIDGKICAGNIFPSSMHGHHDIDIYMMENPDSIISMGSHAETPVMLPVPKIRWETPCRASITNHSSSTEYDVIINGVVGDHISVPEYTLDTPLRFTTVAFQPVAANRTPSGFTMRPYRYFPPGSLTVINAEDIGTGGTNLIRQQTMARRFVELTTTKNSILTFTVESLKGGRAFIELQYADGTSTARYIMRRVSLNGRQCGIVVMPKLYAGPSTTGLSTMVPLDLTPGENVISIDLLPGQESKVKGSVLLDKIRIITE